MPISFHVDHVRRRVVTRASGLVTFSELSEHLDAEEHERALDLKELFDARGATTDITPDQVKHLVQRAVSSAQRISLGPTAIVTHNDLVFGMARMYSILVENVAPVGVFRDLEPAIEWLEGLN
jgi:hypothetical protein